MTDCDICSLANQTDLYYNPMYYAGWKAAMKFAHHAHKEKTYNGFMSANGVLGAGPDSVIVDGDWLEARLQLLSYYRGASND